MGGNQGDGMILARAREHFDQLKRRAPGSDVHTRLLLGALLDELERQAAVIERLSATQPCPRCAQRDEWARGSKVPT